MSEESLLKYCNEILEMRQRQREERRFPEDILFRDEILARELKERLQRDSSVGVPEGWKQPPPHNDWYEALRSAAPSAPQQEPIDIQPGPIEWVPPQHDVGRMVEAALALDDAITNCILIEEREDGSSTNQYVDGDSDYLYIEKSAVSKFREALDKLETSAPQNAASVGSGWISVKERLPKAEVATEDDLRDLHRCGVRHDEDSDSLVMFV